VPTTVQLTSTDDTGSGGLQSSTQSVNVMVNQVNQGPEITVPGRQSVDERSPLIFSTAHGNAITVADADANGNLELVSLAVTNGTLRLSQTTGLTIVSGADGSSAVGVKGTLADLNAGAGWLDFHPGPEFSWQRRDWIVDQRSGQYGAGWAPKDRAPLWPSSSIKCR